MMQKTEEYKIKTRNTKTVRAREREKEIGKVMLTNKQRE